MKVVLALVVLLSGSASFAQGGDVDQGALDLIDASVRYECELGGEKFDGVVELNKEYLVSQPVCMNFGRSDLSVCWSLERHVRVKDVYFTLRYLNQLSENPIPENYVAMGALTSYAQGATITKTVKTSTFRKSELTCILKNIKVAK